MTGRPTRSPTEIIEDLRKRTSNVSKYHSIVVPAHEMRILLEELRRHTFQTRMRLGGEEYVGADAVIDVNDELTHPVQRNLARAWAGTKPKDAA